ncbi:MAG: mechanosensitive ion channel [Sphingomonadales bacterium]|nr:mechanosensitive ion channel [Sphingomonadales bacterium]
MVPGGPSASSSSAGTSAAAAPAGSTRANPSSPCSRAAACPKRRSRRRRPGDPDRPHDPLGRAAAGRAEAEPAAARPTPEQGGAAFPPDPALRRADRRHPDGAGLLGVDGRLRLARSAARGGLRRRPDRGARDRRGRLSDLARRDVLDRISPVRDRRPASRRARAHAALPARQCRDHRARRPRHHAGGLGARHQYRSAAGRRRVIGLAIGFGAQSLVQDIITGVFIQFENAINTGDVVTVAGVTGTVERLSVRSIGIRDVAGTYHLIPFSRVDAVANFNRGFAYHVAEVGIAYKESVAAAKEGMVEAFRRLKESELGSAIIADLDMHGVTALGDSAVVVRARICTEPGQQWAVGRAYNELVKEVFDERDIEMPFPHMTVFMGTDKEGRTQMEPLPDRR